MFSVVFFTVIFFLKIRKIPNINIYVAGWQETFCKHAAAAQGKSTSDPYSVFC